MKTPMARQHVRAGFTLIEMLVVIALVAIFLAMSVPLVANMVRSGRIEAGLNTLRVAVPSARTYAARDYERRNEPFKTLFPTDPTARYSGAAALFTPAGEIRLVQNIATMRDQTGQPMEPLGLNAMADLGDQDYISLPSGVGVMGVLRTVAGLYLVAPPFAIMFTEGGTLDSQGSPSAWGFIYYDSDYNGSINTATSDRASMLYVPEEWSAANAPTDPATGRKQLPFEKIEVVVGVLVYSKYDFRGEGFPFPSSVTVPDSPAPPNPVGQWLLDHGKVTFFSRYGGTTIGGN